MPATLTTPGVYIEEIPSGVHPITGVATSIAAFIGDFERGPVNRAIAILSMADFERTFGGLKSTSEASYAVQQFFINGGTQCWVVRLSGAAVQATGGGTAPTPGAPAALTIKDISGTKNSLILTAGQMIAGTPANSPGAWGNSLHVQVDYDTLDPSKRFNLTVTEIDIQQGRPVVTQTETYRNLTLTAGSASSAVDSINSGSQLVYAQAGDSSADIPAANGAFTHPLPASFQTKIAANSAFTVDSSQGAGPQNATLTSDSNTPVDLRAALEAAIRAAGVTAKDDMLANATVDLWGKGTTASPYRLRVLAGRGSTVRNYKPDAVIKIANATGTTIADQMGFGTGAVAGSSAGSAVQDYTLGSGLDADPATIAAAYAASDAAHKTGLYALEGADLFNILCLPDVAALDAGTMQAAYAAAIAYCDQRRAFCILDVPPNIVRPADMQAWMAANDSLRNKNAAIYYPRPVVPDALNAFRPRSLGASGTIAGLYARIDTERGVWKAPAGTEATLANVPALSYVMGDGENGLLNPLGINALRTFPVYGNVCWGARTLDGADVQASEWKYVPVRRLALFLEESLYRGTKWVVFEPNDEPLWSMIRLNVGAFMHGLFRQGAFQGKTAREAYLVKCDSETTTQNDIDHGIVNIVVGFAPLKPAEFVVIQIQQLAGQIQT